MDVTTKNVKNVWRFNCVSDKKYVCKYEMAFYLSVFFLFFKFSRLAWLAPWLAWLAWLACSNNSLARMTRWLAWLAGLHDSLSCMTRRLAWLAGLHDSLARIYIKRACNQTKCIKSIFSFFFKKITRKLEPYLYIRTVFKYQS